jgi:adenylate cyclase
VSISRRETDQVRVKHHVVLPLVLAVLGVLVALYSVKWTRGFMERRDRQVLDEYHRHGLKTPERDDIMVVAVDDASVTRADAWPEDIKASPALQAMEGRFTSWPRRIWAMTLDQLMKAGARQVFLDLTFFGKTTPEDDQALADALERYKGRVIVGAKFVPAADGMRIDYPNPVISRADIPPDGSWGYLNFWPDNDDIVRRARYETNRFKVEKYENKDAIAGPDDPLVPSIALALARHIDAKAAARVHEWESLRFCSPEAYDAISFHHLFVPDLWKANLKDGAVFKGKTILIGVTTQEQHDVQRSPLGDIDGIKLHANSLTALLSHSFLHHAPPWWIPLSLVAGSLIAWLLITVRHPILGLLAMWGLTAGFVYLTFVLFNQRNIEVSPLPFSLSLNGCGLMGLGGFFWVQLRETRKLRGFISRYHSPDRVARILRDREGLFQTLGGVNRTVTIFFSDVRGFTTLSEGMKAESLVSQINEYFSKMVERVMIFQGAIDKFIGDAVMALWGSLPTVEDDVKQDAMNAVTASLAMRKALEELNADWNKRGMPPIAIGMGINQGPVVVGNIGSASPFEKFEFTVLGDNVNLGSRLEGLTKDYHCDLIVSQSVYEHIKETHYCRPLGETKVKGKEKGVKIYFVEGTRDGRVEPTWFSLYGQAMQACFLEKDIPKARTLMEQCKAQAPEDEMVSYFLGKWTEK